MFALQLRNREGRELMGIVERYRLWTAIRNAPVTVEAPGIVAGREAEVALREQIGESFRFAGAEVFAGRRIPSRRQDRRREIDLIVCGPRRIHLIEVKNWSGRLDLRGRDWIQERRGGGTVNHHDLLAENLLKRDATRDFLDERGLKIDEAFATRYLFPVIMFMNPNLEMDPRIEAMPEVFSRRELDRHLGVQSRKSAAERLIASMIDYCFARSGNHENDVLPPPIEQELYQKIVKRLSETATWDQLRLQGSKTITGDLISLRLANRTVWRAEIVDGAGSRSIILSWTRNPILGWLKVLTGLGSLGSIRIGKRWIKIHLDDFVVFHDVGERESTRRNLVGVESLVVS